MAATDTSPVSRSDANYRTGVLLVLLAGVMWSVMGIGIRHIEVTGRSFILIDSFER